MSMISNACVTARLYVNHIAGLSIYYSEVT